MLDDGWAPYFISALYHALQAGPPEGAGVRDRSPLSQDALVKIQTQGCSAQLRASGGQLKPSLLFVHHHLVTSAKSSSQLSPLSPLLCEAE